MAPLGVVAVYICAALLPRARVWKLGPHAHYLWIQVDRFPGLGETPLLLAACYFPPSPTSNDFRSRAKEAGIIESWSSLTLDIAEAQALGHVLIAGDLNARTGTRWEDATLGPLPPGDPALPGELDDTPAGSLLYQPRLSADQTVDRRGRRLLQLCGATGLRICNGRLPGDDSGASTSLGISGTGCSVVDYFIADSALFPCLACMAVEIPEVAASTIFDHHVLRLQVGGGHPCSPQAPTSPAAPPAMGLPLRLRVHPEVKEALLLLGQSEAFMSTAAGLAETAAAAGTREALSACCQTLDATILAMLATAGAEHLSPPQRHGAERHQVVRARRRERDQLEVQHLDRELEILRRQRQRQEHQASRTAALAHAAENRNAFWKAWKTHDRPAPRVAPAELIAYYTNLFGTSDPIHVARW